jgi:hypothetical protein
MLEELGLRDSQSRTWAVPLLAEMKREIVAWVGGWSDKHVVINSPNHTSRTKKRKTFDTGRQTWGHWFLGIIFRLLFVVLLIFFRPLLMLVPWAIPMAVRVVMLPASRALGRISIPAITVTEFVIEKPSGDPIWAIICFSSESPVPLSMRVAALGDASHSFILRTFFDVAPVEGGLPLAVLFEVVLLRG